MLLGKGVLDFVRKVGTYLSIRWFQKWDLAAGSLFKA